MRTLHFISGLPRSGSTLLANILAQHPDVHATPTSACHEALFVLRNAWPEWVEHKAAPHLAEKHNFARVANAVLHSYHDTNKPVVIDKGRGWLSLLELAEVALGRPARVLVPVRSIAQIAASFEKIHRKTAAYRRDQGDYFAAQTVEGRVNQLLAGNGVVGLAYNRLKDAFARGLGNRLHLVEFESLTTDPRATMAGVVSFLGLSPFTFNFDHVEQATHENDEVHGMPLHTIRPEVRPVRDDSADVLGWDMVAQLANSNFWR